MGGEKASALACEAAARLWKADEQAPDGEVKRLLERMVAAADGAIVEEVGRDLSYLGMGTTLTLALIRNGCVYIAHVGDSRVYLLRDGTLSQLTVDHTEVQRLVDAGHLTPEEAKVSPYRSRLTQAVGVGMDLDVFLREEPLQPEDWLLMCSDGLSDMVDDVDIQGILAEAQAPVETCRRLVDAANAAGGIDNISVVVIGIPGETGAG